MNETIRELRCAMDAAQTIGEDVDDIYSLGMAAGIGFALEHIDEGSTDSPPPALRPNTETDEPYKIKWSDHATNGLQDQIKQVVDKAQAARQYHAFLAHGY